MLLLAMVSLPTAAMAQFGGPYGGVGSGPGHHPASSRPSATPSINSEAATPPIAAPTRGTDLARGGPTTRRGPSWGVEDVLNDPHARRGPNGRIDTCAPARRQIRGGRMISGSPRTLGGPLIFDRRR